MKQNPIWFELNPFKHYFPAIISILHRLSGILLFFMIPVLLWGLQESLNSADQFTLYKSNLSNLFFKIGLWIILSALVFHWFAGIRHMLMDLHIGETKRGGKIGSWIVLILSILFSIFIVYVLI